MKKSTGIRDTFTDADTVNKRVEKIPVKVIGTPGNELKLFGPDTRVKAPSGGTFRIPKNDEFWAKRSLDLDAELDRKYRVENPSADSAVTTRRKLTEIKEAQQHGRASGTQTIVKNQQQNDRNIEAWVKAKLSGVRSDSWESDAALSGKLIKDINAGKVKITRGKNSKKQGYKKSTLAKKIGTIKDSIKAERH